MRGSNEQKRTSIKGETWSRGTNSRLPFDVNVKLNLSNNGLPKRRSNSPQGDQSQGYNFILGIYAKPSSSD